jgi:hypothetical protein
MTDKQQKDKGCGMAASALRVAEKVSRHLSGQSDQIEKKTIKELREEAELKKLWKKSCEIADELKHSTGTEFQEDHFR